MLVEVAGCLDDALSADFVTAENDSVERCKVERLEYLLLRDQSLEWGQAFAEGGEAHGDGGGDVAGRADQPYAQG